MPTVPPVVAAVDAGPVRLVPPDSPTSTSTATSTSVASRTCQPPSGSPLAGGGETGDTSGTRTASPDGGAGKGATVPLSLTPDGGVGNGNPPSVAPTPGTQDEPSVDGGVGKGNAPSVPPAPTANGGEATSTAPETTAASTRGSGCSVAPGGLPGNAIIVLGLCMALGLLARKRGQQ
jgi:hypothetical protein